MPIGYEVGGQYDVVVTGGGWLTLMVQGQSGERKTC